MFKKTMAYLAKDTTIWLEAEAMLHTLKEEHKLFKLYKSMGFTTIGPLRTKHAEKDWKERENDGQDNSKLGSTKEQQIKNLKWQTVLMVRSPGV